MALGSVFSEKELDQLEAVAATAQETASIVAGVDASTRRSKVIWAGFEPANAWLYRRIGEAVSGVNAEHYRFDLTGIGEPIQLARYEAEQHGHYGWHQDYGVNDVSRKLAVTVQLTDPNVYTGGELEIMVTSKTLETGRERGLVIVFPAYQLHRVTPVEKGIRHSLVSWISGPPFR